MREVRENYVALPLFLSPQLSPLPCLCRSVSPGGIGGGKLSGGEIAPGDGAYHPLCFRIDLITTLPLTGGTEREGWPCSFPGPPWPLGLLDDVAGREKVKAPAGAPILSPFPGAHQYRPSQGGRGSGRVLFVSCSWPIPLPAFSKAAYS